jgi:hypothetical protein
MGGGPFKTYEINSNGGDVRLGVGVVGESQQKARLSNTGITDEEKLEQVVVPRTRSVTPVSRRTAHRDSSILRIGWRNERDPEVQVVSMRHYVMPSRGPAGAKQHTTRDSLSWR